MELKLVRLFWQGLGSNSLIFRSTDGTEISQTVLARAWKQFLKIAMNIFNFLEQMGAEELIFLV